MGCYIPFEGMYRSKALGYSYCMYVYMSYQEHITLLLSVVIRHCNLYVSGIYNEL